MRESFIHQVFIEYLLGTCTVASTGHTAEKEEVLFSKELLLEVPQRESAVFRNHPLKSPWPRGSEAQGAAGPARAAQG